MYIICGKWLLVPQGPWITYAETKVILDIGVGVLGLSLRATILGYGRILWRAIGLTKYKIE